MLTDIEEKIVERLNQKLTGVNKVSVDEAHSSMALNVPVVDVIVGGGSFARVAQSWKITPQVFVIVTFQNLISVEQRRRGVYPVLLSILALLIGNKLGLKIEALAPKRLDNITNAEEADEGKILFQIEFETGFVITQLSEEEITDLLKVGLNYYLKPGDEVVDASDLVTLAQAGE